MYGREARLPVDVFTGPVKEVTFDVDQYKTFLTAHLRKAYEVVRENLFNAAVARKESWDGKVTSHVTYSPRDLVLVYQPKTASTSKEVKHSHIWVSDWRGPFEIVSRKFDDNEDVYLIKDDKTKREWTINVNKLRPYVVKSFLSSELSSGVSSAGGMSAEKLDYAVEVNVPEQATLVQVPAAEQASEARKALPAETKDLVAVTEEAVSDVVSEAGARTDMKLGSQESLTKRLNVPIHVLFLVTRKQGIR
jgi:hypothetical protein